MRKPLLSDNLPYLLTVLFGLVAYQLNHIVTYVSELPLIAFDYRILNQNDSSNMVTQNLEIEIENINRKKGFDNLVFDVKYSSEFGQDSEISSPELIPIAPAAILPDTLVTNRHLRLNHYVIPRLHPGGLYLMRLTVRHPKKIKDFPKLYLRTNQDIWLTETNWEVFVVSHQLGINIMLLILWTVLILFYFYFITKNNSTGNEQKS
jgi:hypothetical protein